MVQAGRMHSGLHHRRLRMLERVDRVHMVGIGGSGMSGIAELLTNLGYEVTGSDLESSETTERLSALGVRIAEGHDAGHVGNADMVIVSSAVPGDNPEIVEAKRQAIPVVRRGAMLAELTGLRSGIAIVGSHGKTTTAAMTALVLNDAGFDPTVAIGGRLSVFGSNARLGHGRFMVVEADESDRSFLHLSPEIAVLTNIDDEHLEAYDGIEDLERAFTEFAGSIPNDGCVIACIADHRLRSLVEHIDRPVLTYGIDESDADICAENLTLGPDGSRCEVKLATETAGETFNLRLGVPGRHNVLNALAAVAVGVRLGVPTPSTRRALSSFTGADRRFQVYDEVDGVLVIDDYGHHPTEITAVLETARLRAGRRLIVVFQPHRYTRTLRLLDRFAPALALADELILTPVYPASESPIPGATSHAIADAVRRVSSIPIQLIDSLDEAARIAASHARYGEVIVTLGAGSISRIAPQIVAALAARNTGRPFYRGPA